MKSSQPHAPFLITSFSPQGTAVKFVSYQQHLIHVISVDGDLLHARVQLFYLLTIILTLIPSLSLLKYKCCSFDFIEQVIQFGRDWSAEDASWLTGPNQGA